MQVISIAPALILRSRKKRWLRNGIRTADRWIGGVLCTNVSQTRGIVYSIAEMDSQVFKHANQIVLLETMPKGKRRCKHQPTVPQQQPTVPKKDPGPERLSKRAFELFLHAARHVIMRPGTTDSFQIQLPRDKKLTEEQAHKVFRSAILAASSRTAHLQEHEGAKYVVTSNINPEGAWTGFTLSTHECQFYDEENETNYTGTRVTINTYKD